MEKTNNHRGSTLIELLMVMSLLILFGVTGFTLVYSGADTQERIIKEKNAQTDARIALSYINVRLRQNDTEGKIAVEKILLTGENAIVIRERTIDYEYDTWIFCHNGKLMECLVDPGAPPTELDSFYIVDVESLETEFNTKNSCITNTVYYYYGDSIKNISSTVHLRTSAA